MPRHRVVVTDEVAEPTPVIILVSDLFVSRPSFIRWLVSACWTFACFATFDYEVLGTVEAHPFLWTVLITLLRQAISRDATISVVAMLHVWLLTAPVIYWSLYHWGGIAGIFMINYPLMLLVEESVLETAVLESSLIPHSKSH